MLILDFLRDKFSYSKLDTFSKCPRRFFYRYIMRKREGTSFQVFGRAVHSGMETDNRAKLEGKRLPIGAVLDAAVESYKTEAARENMRPCVDSFVETHKPQLDKFEASGLRDQICPAPGSVEAPFEVMLRVGNPESGEPEIPAKIEGFVDVVSLDPASGLRTVVDYKTGAKPVYQRDAEESLQFELYQLGAEAEATMAVSFVRGGRQKPTTKATVRRSTPSRREKLLEWIADTLRSIRRCLTTGDFPKCSPACFWCSRKACDFYGLCYPEKNTELPKLVQVEKLSPVGTVDMPDWRKGK